MEQYQLLNSGECVMAQSRLPFTVYCLLQSQLAWICAHLGGLQ